MLTFGNTVLQHGVMLAPMAGVTDTSFRLLCRRFGAEYTVSEMVSAKALCYEQRSHRKESGASCTAQLARITKEEAPMAVQLFGSEPEFMAEAARLLKSGEYRGCASEVAPAAIDINMAIVRAVRSAVSLPVTVKIRAGWDAEHINAVELARRLEAAGADLICVHARTREQLYAPGIMPEVIAEVKAAVKIPVVGNGDIFSAEDALKMKKDTGCDGVMIGRGAMGHPWIFREIVDALEGKQTPAMSLDERLSVAAEHLDAMLADKGERTGVAEAKKHMAWYISGIPGAAAARGSVMTATSPEELRAVLEDFRNGYGRERSR